MRNVWAGSILGLLFPLGAFLWRLASTQKKILERLISEQDSMKSSYENVNLLAVMDGLTGVYNHRYLQEKLAQEIARVERHRVPLSCLMADIDDFKRVNDRHGHASGDLVLVTVARIIRENIRRIDIVGRYGGEEFLVVMPHTSEDVAFVIAERIRLAVQNYSYPFKAEGMNVAVSMGVAAASLDRPSKTDLLKAADEALYQAKHEGKNRTVIWSKEPRHELSRT